MDDVPPAARPYHAGMKKRRRVAVQEAADLVLDEVNRVIDSELSKNAARLKAFSVKLRYHVGRNGRVQAIEIISATPDRSAANRLAYLIRGTAFPPYPQAVLQQGIDSIEGELNWKWIPDKPKK